jgi:hypothetical protein
VPLDVHVGHFRASRQPVSLVSIGLVGISLPWQPRSW